MWSNEHESREREEMVHREEMALHNVLVRECASVCERVFMCDKGESTLLRIFANSLITYTVYMHTFTSIFSMSNY